MRVIALDSSLLVIALKMRVGYHEKVVAAMRVAHVAIGLTIIHPFSITAVAKLVIASYFQVNRECPVSIAIRSKRMR